MFEFYNLEGVSQLNSVRVQHYMPNIQVGNNISIK